MYNRLKQFYDDEGMREEVKHFFFEQLDNYALEELYKGEDIQGFKEAKRLVRRAFTKLDFMYGNRKLPKRVPKT